MYTKDKYDDQSVLIFVFSGTHLSMSITILFFP